ncbi:hypothetical protein ACP4OV_022387 [Aristida adscensionis]
MEGRHGRSSGKGTTGKTVSLQEFVSSMAPLIDLKKISAESETSAKTLERRGYVIANLKCTDAQAGLMRKTSWSSSPTWGMCSRRTNSLV